MTEYSPLGYIQAMPKKIRQLIAAPQKAGFVNRGGKGSHRNFEHPGGIAITISGKEGSDAKPYQEKQTEQAIKQAKGK